MNVIIRNREDFIFGLLALQTVPSLGPVRIRKLVQVAGDPLALLEKSDKEISQVKGIHKQILYSLRNEINFALAEKHFNLLKSKNIEVITLWDEDYPKSLRNISDPPPLLFYKGDLSITQSPSLVIVGTRKPSSYGIVVTKKLASELSDFRIPIVSGLARGVDTIAHQTALINKNKTIAVLASGLDYIYPPENRELANKITHQGLLVSEFPPGIRPEPSYFTRRNRIISGLAEGVIVIEAGKSSGALITANYALDQNREIFAVPGQITNPQAIGCLYLIQAGAKCLISIQDIFDELPYLSTNRTEVQQDLSLLTDEQQKVLELIGFQPVHLDQLIQKAGLPSQDINAILLDLEMEGLVQQLPGKFFVKL